MPANPARRAGRAAAGEEGTMVPIPAQLRAHRTFLIQTKTATLPT